MEKTLTTENNNVKLPVAEQLVLVGDAGPETAGPPQGQSEQDLTLLLVQRNRLTVALVQTVVIHGAQLEEETKTNSSRLAFLGASGQRQLRSRFGNSEIHRVDPIFSTINV